MASSVEVEVEEEEVWEVEVFEGLEEELLFVVVADVVLPVELALFEEEVVVFFVLLELVVLTDFEDVVGMA